MLDRSDNWKIIYAEPAFSIMHVKMNDEKCEKSFYGMLAILIPFKCLNENIISSDLDVIPDTSKNEKENEDAIVLLDLESFDTLLEIKDWAREQWRTRQEQEWYEQAKEFLDNNLKSDVKRIAL